MAFFTFLISPIGRWLAGVAVVGLIIGGAYWRGDSNGYARAMARVEAQQKRAIAIATKARETLERACERDSEACVPEEWFRADEDE